MNNFFVSIDNILFIFNLMNEQNLNNISDTINYLTEFYINYHQVIEDIDKIFYY